MKSTERFMVGMLKLNMSDANKEALGHILWLAWMGGVYAFLNTEGPEHKRRDDALAGFNAWLNDEGA